MLRLNHVSSKKYLYKKRRVPLYVPFKLIFKMPWDFKTASFNSHRFLATLIRLQKPTALYLWANMNRVL